MKIVTGHIKHHHNHERHRERPAGRRHTDGAIDQWNCHRTGHRSSALIPIICQRPVSFSIMQTLSNPLAGVWRRPSPPSLTMNSYTKNALLFILIRTILVQCSAFIMIESPTPNTVSLLPYSWRCNMTLYPDSNGCHPSVNARCHQSVCLCPIVATSGAKKALTVQQNSASILLRHSHRFCLKALEHNDQCQHSAQCPQNSECLANNLHTITDERHIDWRCRCILGFKYHSEDGCKAIHDVLKPCLNGMIYIPHMKRCINMKYLPYYAHRGAGRAGGGRGGGRGGGGVGGRTSGSRAWFTPNRNSMRKNPASRSNCEERFLSLIVCFALCWRLMIMHQNIL